LAGLKILILKNNAKKRKKNRAAICSGKCPEAKEKNLVWRVIVHFWKCFWYIVFIPDYGNQKKKQMGRYSTPLQWKRGG
jgi:hypothetical protein